MTDLVALGDDWGGMLSDLATWAAAAVVLIALTHLNSWYVADQVGVGVALLVEGIVLLLGGLGAQRLRRQMVAREAGSEAPAA